MSGSVNIVRQHLEGAQAYDFAKNIAPGARWIWDTGIQYEMTTGAQSYRSITQAWDFPITSYSLRVSAEGGVLAALKLDNGNGYSKAVDGEFQIVDDAIVSIVFHDFGTGAKHA